MKSIGPLLLAFLLFSCDTKQTGDYSGWRTYAGSKDGIRYSSNGQITPSNVASLKEAWVFSSGDKDPDNRSQNQCNPIVVDGVLYGTSPRLKLFALNAATGETKWLFDPAMADSLARYNKNAFFSANRGVAYWQDEASGDKRIFYSTGSRIYAINAADGTPISSFAKGGYLDITENLDREPGTFNPYVSSTTPGIIYKDLLILGHRVSESADAAPGHVRAFDVRTGERKWIFHTIPHPGEKNYETWPDTAAWKKLGGANSWAGMSLDEKRGIVYVPTGSIGGDFYGGFRKGQNLYSNSLIALEAATGKYRWHFQVVHHDLWDRDLPANPNLITIKKEGKSIDAVAQITKHGYIFLFNRETGEPVFPIEEKPVPQDALPGEEPWPTQPIPTLPENFSRQSFTAGDVWGVDEEAKQALVDKFNTVKYSEPFMPPSKEGTWIFPGFDGGGEWGGSAVDPETGILYVNSSELPWSMHMVDAGNNEGNATLEGYGKIIYNRYCLSCHGPELKGNGTSYPGLTRLDKKYKPGEAWRIIAAGKNMMPAFQQISGLERDALLAFLYPGQEKEPGAIHPAGEKKKGIMDEVRYNMTGYNRFLDVNGYPGIKPPWGTLNAINLNSGKLLWKVTLGEFDELTKKGIPPTGTETYGGPLVTKGGLVFIAGTKDEKIRAFDKETGKVLWEAKLPAAGFATPATYMVDGKQYVVIACGGGKIGNPSGDRYVAFALP